MTLYLEKNALPATLWQARIGDSYFISGNYTAALQQYQQILEQSTYKTSLYKKISDIAFIQGDTQTERNYRELVKGIETTVLDAGRYGLSHDLTSNLKS